MNGNGTVRCDACGELTPAVNKPDLPEHGLSINVPSMTYYAGFTDLLPGDLTEQEERFHICHDCSVRLMRTFPALGARIGFGGHPCDDETPCCDWAWKRTGGVTFIAEQGKWVIVLNKPAG